MAITQSDIPSRTQASVADDVIDKQERFEALIGDLAPTKSTTVIASPTADVASLKTAVDEIRAALTASGITA